MSRMQRYGTLCEASTQEHKKQYRRNNGSRKRVEVTVWRGARTRFCRDIDAVITKRKLGRIGGTLTLLLQTRVALLQIGRYVPAHHGTGGVDSIRYKCDIMHRLPQHTVLLRQTPPDCRLEEECFYLTARRYLCAVVEKSRQ